ncbi:hypothetical protein A4G19_10540 [Pasteurellaceae bacterium Macca]|nr:hypothetical protein [Pasteurellaceae bacterium Macca]
MNFMPEKNPDIWMQIAAWWATHHNSLCGFTAGFVVALGRSFLYGKGSWRKNLSRRFCVDSCLHRSSDIAVFPIKRRVDYANWCHAWLVGIDFIRATFLKIINKRVENE